jgi:hypothetical protein
MLAWPNPRVPSVATDSTLGYFRVFPTGKLQFGDPFGVDAKLFEHRQMFL